jgi:hypothetical protein
LQEEYIRLETHLATLVNNKSQFVSEHVRTLVNHLRAHWPPEQLSLLILYAVAVTFDRKPLICSVALILSKGSAQCVDERRLEPTPLRLTGESLTLEYVCYQRSTEDNRGRFGVPMARNSAKNSAKFALELT